MIPLAANHRQNILRTAAEKRRGKEPIALTTPYGATQLNQGDITGPQEKPRGKGFELKTDKHGVIRVDKGLFITAGGQQKATGEVLDMATALRGIDVCLQQPRQLEMAADVVCS